jgi:hypothetical protein
MRSADVILFCGSLAAGCTAATMTADTPSPRATAEERLADLAREKLDKMPVNESGLIIGEERQALGRNVPWYIFRADPKEVEDGSVWGKVPCPEGTKTAVVGYCEHLSGCLPFDEQHGRRVDKVLRFRQVDELQVGPGSGGIVPFGGEGYAMLTSHDMITDEQIERSARTGRAIRARDLPFTAGRRYVLCFSARPEVPPAGSKVERGVAIAGLWPSVVGVIEIMPSRGQGIGVQGGPG